MEIEAMLKMLNEGITRIIMQNFGCRTDELYRLIGYA